jgi:nucleoside-diphosphate-sugar epimerase
MKKNILIVGGFGNLGSVLLPLISQDYNVLLPDRGLVKYWAGLDLKKISRRDLLIGDLNPDLVLNLATFYLPNPTQSDLEKMEESIVGVAEVIAEVNTLWRAPIIGVSSYFQFAPQKLQPWSPYSEMKKKATEILKNSCQFSDSDFTEIVLHDNYGGQRKNKFLDVLIDSFKNGFSILFSVTSLNSFSSDEICEFLSSGNNEKWNRETLMQNILTNHGYDRNS